MFSAAGLSRLLRSLVPFVVIATLAVGLLQRDVSRLAHAARFDGRGLLAQLGALLFELAWKFGLVLLAWSALDYFLQRHNYERSLRMTKEEVKQENKDSEGHPLVRSHR
jgi:flagellar biosynthetic protein FlhB